MISEDCLQELRVVLAVLHLPALVLLDFKSVEVVGEGGFELVLQTVVVYFDVKFISARFEGCVESYVREVCFKLRSIVFERIFVQLMSQYESRVPVVRLVELLVQ